MYIDPKTLNPNEKTDLFGFLMSSGFRYGFCGCGFGDLGLMADGFVGRGLPVLVAVFRVMFGP